MNKYPDGIYVTKVVINGELRQIIITNGLVQVCKGGYEFSQDSFFEANQMVGEFEGTDNITLTDKLTQATEEILLTYQAKDTGRSLNEIAKILISERSEVFGENLLGYFTAKGWELEDNQEFDDFLDKLLTKYVY